MTTTSTSKPRILVVDDDAATASMLSRSLTRHGFKVDTAGTPADALARVQKERYDAAILDLVMPGQDGVGLAAALRQTLPGLPVAVMTGYANSPLLADARKLGIGVFAKPVPIQEVADFLKTELGQG